MAENKNILTLDRISKKDKSEVSKDVSDTLLLLQTNQSSEEIEMLKKIGLDNHIRNAEQVQNNIQRFTVLEQKFGRNVYSATQIKKYCEANGMKIIRVDDFNHQVPVVVGEEIIKFIKERTILHEKNENRSFEKHDLNIGTSYFFILTSIQSINGAPVKSATLFYREEYPQDFYRKISDRDMLIEVYSWGVPGNERSLLWEYVKGTDYFLLTPLIFLFIGILVTMFGSSYHGSLLFLNIVSIVAVLLITKKSFFKWNSN